MTPIPLWYAIATVLLAIGLAFYVGRLARLDESFRVFLIVTAVVIAVFFNVIETADLIGARIWGDQ